MWDVPCTRSEGCMVLTPHIRCSKLGMERKGGHNKDYFMPPNPDVEGCSTTNQHGHSHQSTDQPNSGGDGCGKVWPQGSSYRYFSIFQPILAQGFPKTDVLSVHLSCVNIFSVCQSPINILAPLSTAEQGTGLTWEGAPPFVCVSSHFLLVFVVEKKQWKSNSSPSWQCQYVFSI